MGVGMRQRRFWREGRLWRGWARVMSAPVTNARMTVEPTEAKRRGSVRNWAEEQRSQRDRCHHYAFQPCRYGRCTHAFNSGMLVTFIFGPSHMTVLQRP